MKNYENACRNQNIKTYYRCIGKTKNKIQRKNMSEKVEKQIIEEPPKWT